LRFQFRPKRATSFDGCKAQGKRKITDKNPTGEVPIREQGLNVLKNRGTKPSRIKRSITLDSLIAAKEETDLDPNTGVEITAFVAHVKDGEPGESCNCGRSDLEDVHIEVVGNEADKGNKKKFVIFEISPRLENELGDASTLKDQIEGKWVKFTGWLTYDYKHRGNASNRKKTGNIWRATAWELHPITAWKIVSKP
jgi:hypothetical protein